MKYKKISGFANGKGQLYEYGMAALLNLRSLRFADRFLLGTNLDGFGQFDDLFLRLVQADGQGQQRESALFLQLKHVEDKNSRVTQHDLVERKGNFKVNLKKLYESYCAIEKKITASEYTVNSEVLNNLKIEDCTFILFTSCAIEHHSPNCATKLDLVHLVNTRGKDGEIFSFGCEDKKIWNVHRDNPHYHTFLSKLVVFSRQCHADQLTQIVGEEVKGLCKGKEHTCSDYLKEMKIWWQSKDISDFLYERSPLWFMILMKDLNSKLFDNLKTKYSFQHDNCNILELQINNNMFLSIVVPGVNSNLRCLKLLLELENKYRGEYLLMDYKEVIERQDAVLSVCKTGRCKFLVVNTSNSSKIDRLTETFHVELCKLVIVCQRHVGPEDSRFNHLEQNWTFDQLTKESQDDILATTVNFQGEEVCLGDLYDSHTKHIPGTSILIPLIQGGGVSVGTAPGGADSLYVPRTLCHQVALRDDVLHAAHDGSVLLVSGLTHGKMGTTPFLALERRNVESLRDQINDRTSHCVLLSNISQHSNVDKTNFLRLCEMFPERSIHWLKCLNGLVLWEDSRGIAQTLAEYMVRMSSTCGNGKRPVCSHIEGILSDWEERLIMITGEAGMGKSMLLQHLAALLKLKYPATWVIHVALNDITEDLYDMPVNDVTYNKVVDILFNVASIKTSPYAEEERNLLMDSLERTGNVYVLIDAVDEVAPEYTEKVLRILQCLLKTRVHRVYVTSRTVLQEHLQRKLSAQTLVLQPFTEKEQIIFFTQYTDCALPNPGIPRDNVKKLVEKLLNLVKKEKDSSGRHVCDVPLLARMVADLLIEQAKGSSVFGSDSDELHTLNLLRVYGDFFEKKIELHFKKCGIDTRKALNQESTKKTRGDMMDILMKCALVVFFSPKEYNMLNIANLEKTVENFLQTAIMERTGIINGSSHNKAKFVHYTFCEFLVAKWCHKYYEESEYANSSIFGKSEFHEIWFENRLDLVRLFFDQMISKGCELHEAVLTGNLKQVTKVLESGVPVDCRDNGDRLAVHLAVSHSHYSVIELLLAYGSPVAVRDKVLWWNTYEYADRIPWYMTSETNRILKNVGSDTRLHMASKGGHVKLVSTLLQEESDVNRCDKDDMSPLMHAALCGKLDVARMLIEHGAEVCMCNHDGMSPLMYAAEGGDLDLTRLLIERGADVSKCDNDCKSSLMYAAEGGHKELARLLIEHGAGVNQCDSDGKYPLMYTAQEVDVNVARLLIEHGAGVSKCDSDGKTTLMYAAQWGNLELAQLLIEHGAHVGKCDSNKSSPLMYAAQRGHIEVVRLLIKYGADVSKCDGGGRSPLMCAAKEGELEVARLLIDHGSDTFNCDGRGMSPLMYAAQWRDFELASLLIERGSDVNKCDRGGMSPLSYAVLGGEFEITRLLIEHGADARMCDRYGLSPLMMAAQQGDVVLSRLLVANGADASKCDSYGKTPLMFAAQSGDMDVARLLIEHGADASKCDGNGESPLMYAAQRANVELARLLIELGADATLCDSHGKSTLMYAAERGDLEFVRLLIEHGADACKCDSDGKSTLMYAAKGGKLEVVRLLIQYETDANKCDSDGKSTLIYAAMQGKLEVARLLIALGADASKCDSAGKSTLMYAAQEGYLEIVRLLIEHGVDVNVCSRKGDTALSLAAEEGYRQVATLLLKSGAEIKPK